MVTLNSPQGELLQVGIDAVRTTELGMMPPTCWTLNKIAPLRRLGKMYFYYLQIIFVELVLAAVCFRTDCYLRSNLNLFS